MASAKARTRRWRRELAGQTRMDGSAGEEVADQGEFGNSHHDRRAPVDASEKYF